MTERETYQVFTLHQYLKKTFDLPPLRNCIEIIRLLNLLNRFSTFTKFKPGHAFENSAELINNLFVVDVV